MKSYSISASIDTFRNRCKYSQRSECESTNPIVHIVPPKTAHDNARQLTLLVFLPNLPCRGVFHEGSGLRRDTDAVDMILLADELFRGDHQLV